MDLFSQDTRLPTSAALQIEMPLTKDQKAFNTLIKKIDAKRSKLAEWQVGHVQFKQQYRTDLFPLQEQELALQIQLTQALDLAHGGKGLSKGERNKLSVMIVELTDVILSAQDDAGMKKLYNKHSRSDFDAEQAAEKEDAKAIFEHMFGVDLGDDVDMSSPEDVLHRFEQQFRAEMGQASEQPSPKKTAKQQAKADRLAAQEAQISQSIREVFRKLASALHPDREQDPAEKQRKTALMQRANDAYQKGNLLQLLELQLELEHIDQAHLAGLSAERLKHYLKILKGQLKEIEQEIFHIEEDLKFELSLPPFQRLQPGDLTVLLQQHKNHCEISLRTLQEQINISGDLPQLKAMLKSIKLQRCRPDPDFYFDIPF